MKPLFLLFITLLAFSTSAKPQKNTILTIDKQQISVAEFERIYQKNNTQLNQESDIKSPADYLNLFIDFKLKVIEAENQGYDTLKAFKDELSGYRAELAKPYLTDVSFSDSLVKSTYFRITNEINASHILINAAPDASSEDTLAAYNKIMNIRSQIVSGTKKFEELASELSDDPSAKSNGGNLGFFKGFTMVTPFEDCAYTTPKDSVSLPIRTQFGYHIIKVNDIQPSQGEVRVAHIMKMFSSQSPSDEEVSKLKTEIDSIYKLAKAGEDFGALAAKLSDDKRSAQQNGEMPFFGKGQMIPDFANPAFEIKEIGGISEIVRTDYGWHIIKMLERKAPPSFEESKADLEQKIKNDPQRSNYNKIAFVNKLKKEYNFIENKDAFDSLLNHVKNSKTEVVTSNDFDIIGNQTLFTFADKKQTISNYIKSFINQTDTTNQVSVSEINNGMQNYIETTLTNYEDSRLEEKYPEFKFLIQEYHDGILLFNIMESEVWNKAINDSIGLEAYYAKNTGKYFFKEHFEGLIISCPDQGKRDTVEMILSQGNHKPEEIKQFLNDSTNSVSIQKGKWEKGDNAIVDYYVWNSEKPSELNDQLTFIYGDKLANGVKTLSEARGAYISDYQEYLEKIWIESLRKKYKIAVNKKELKKVKSII